MKLEAVCHYFSSNGYTVLKSIGKGAFAEVFLIENGTHFLNLANKELLAAKVINKETFKKKPYIEKYLHQ